MLRPLSGPPLRLRKREADATIRPALRRRVATDESKLRELLQSFQQGSLSLEEMLEHLRRLPYEDIGFAELDHHRALRRGFPEVILGEGKSEEQVVAIAERLAAGSDRLLITRVDVETYGAVKERLPDAHYHADARAITLDRSGGPRWPGVVVLCAGTSDLPVAEEAAVTAELMGSQAERYYDVGIAGLHRLLDKLFVPLAARTYVHVENVGLAVVHSMLEQPGVLGRVHAADLRAVGHALGLVARPHALDPDHVFGLLAVRGPEYLAQIGPGGREHPLHLQPVDDVGVLAVAVLPVDALGQELIARGDDDGADLLGDDLVFLIEDDCLGDPARRTGPTRLTDRTWLGHFYTAATLQVQVAMVAGEPDVPPAIYQRGQQRR
ncbi:hypothetical protein LCGC14_1459610, partial [marine sediment metagenome]